MPKFIHLHTHSDFSMIDGIAKVNTLVKEIANMQMPAFAITDFTNLCGLVKFYGSAMSNGIKPIIGADIIVRSTESPNDFYDLTILAANNDGYHNLTLLISKAYQRGYIGDFPVVDQRWLTEHHEGLIILAGRKSDVGLAISRDNQMMLDSALAFYNEYFPNHFYFELVRTNRANEEQFIHVAVKLAEQHHLPVVASNDVRFLHAADFEAHEIRVAIHDGNTLDDPNRPKNYSPEQYLRSEEEMCELFSDIPEALANSVEIAKRCNVTIRLGEYFLPQLDRKSVV